MKNKDKKEDKVKLEVKYDIPDSIRLNKAQVESLLDFAITTLLKQRVGREAANEESVIPDKE